MKRPATRSQKAAYSWVRRMNVCEPGFTASLGDNAMSETAHVPTNASEFHGITD
jgi:hypothetical protein